MQFLLHLQQALSSPTLSYKRPKVHFMSMSSQIKALLLAAGFGTRLRPITDSTPKCLVEIEGLHPGRWINELEKINCDSILINTHYLANQVNEYVDHIQPECSSKLSIIHEEQLLGTCGTLLANQSFFADSTGLLIHADNATSADLQELISAHHDRPNHCLLTMLTFNTTNPQSCGIVEIDKEGVVIRFHENLAGRLVIEPMGQFMFLILYFLKSYNRWGPASQTSVHKLFLNFWAGFILGILTRHT